MTEKTRATETPDSGNAAFVAPTTWNSAETLRLDGDAVEKLAELGAAAAGANITIVEFDGGGAGLPLRFPVAIHHGHQPKISSLKALAEEWRFFPDRKSGQAVVGSLDSFIGLTNRHKTEHSVVFADSDWTKPGLTAVIDYHPVDTDRADNGGHRVHYTFPLSDEWKEWVKNNGRPMDQVDFASFVEDRIPDITAPEDATRNWVEHDLQTTVATPAQLIQLARGLQVNVEARVKNNVTLQSGEGKLVFEETHTGADGAPISVPGAFVLYVAPFFRGDPVEIPVRLRYRVKNSEIKWFYQIYRPDRIIAEAVDHARASVARETGLPVYEGTPEMRQDGVPVADRRARVVSDERSERA